MKTSGSFRARASAVRMISCCEAAWLGALIEGEGHVGFVHHAPHQPFINVASTDVETIATILRLVGQGRIAYVTPRNPRHKPQLLWQLGCQFAVLDLLAQIIPYLTGKRDVAYAAIRGVYDRRPLEVEAHVGA